PGAWGRFSDRGGRPVIFVPLLESRDLLLGFVFRDAVGFLNLAAQDFPLARDDVEVVVGEIAPLLAHVALELLPVAFDHIPVHIEFPSLIERPARLLPAVVLRGSFPASSESLSPSHAGVGTLAHTGSTASVCYRTDGERGAAHPRRHLPPAWRFFFRPIYGCPAIRSTDPQVAKSLASN